MTEFIDSPYDGTCIPVISTPSTGVSRRVVHILLHGLGTSKDEYLGFYQKLADHLSSRGHSSVRFDFRSHGESAAEEQEFTPLNCLSDALAVLGWVRGRFPGYEVRIFGTSFGASIALLLANIIRDEIRRINLLSPVLDYERLYIYPAERGRKARFGGMLRTTGIEGVPHAATDELNFHQRMVLELSAVSVPAVISQVDAYVEVMHGKADETVPLSETKRLMRHFRRARLTAFARMEHGFTKAGDEAGTSPETQANLDRIIDIAVG